MSTTNSQLIRDALGLIGVLAETQSVSAEQAQLGLRVLNELIASWGLDGIDLQYFEQTEPGDETPIPDHSIAAVKHALAISLAPYFGMAVTPEFIEAADRHYSRFIRDVVKDQVQEARMDHLHPGTNRGPWDITRG